MMTRMSTRTIAGSPPPPAPTDSSSRRTSGPISYRSSTPSDPRAAGGISGPPPPAGWPGHASDKPSCRDEIRGREPAPSRRRRGTVTPRASPCIMEPPMPPTSIGGSVLTRQIRQLSAFRTDTRPGGRRSRERIPPGAIRRRLSLPRGRGPRPRRPGSRYLHLGRAGGHPDWPVNSARPPPPSRSGSGCSRATATSAGSRHAASASAAGPSA